MREETGLSVRASEYLQIYDRPRRGAIAILFRVLGQRQAVRKKDPAINDFNQPLKDAGVLDVPAWRQIQRLGDIRNLCDHNKHREPTKDEVIELIDGVDKISKTLF